MMDHSIYIHGVKFPNRIFVGGLSKLAEAEELAQFFETFGCVTEAKIIQDPYGTSKGFGFITFTSQKDVDNVLRQGQLFFQGRKLNLGPAVRKQSPDVVGEPVVVIQTPSPVVNNGRTGSPKSKSPPASPPTVTTTSYPMQPISPIIYPGYMQHPAGGFYPHYYPQSPPCLQQEFRNMSI